MSMEAPPHRWGDANSESWYGAHPLRTRYPQSLADHLTPFGGVLIYRDRLELKCRWGVTPFGGMEKASPGVSLAYRARFPNH